MGIWTLTWLAVRHQDHLAMEALSALESAEQIRSQSVNVYCSVILRAAAKLLFHFQIAIVLFIVCLSVLNPDLLALNLIGIALKLAVPGLKQ